MKDGFVRVAAATPEIRVADCTYNEGQIIRLMRKAADRGVRLLALPELCITGYTCGDLFLQNTLLGGALAALRNIREASKGLGLVTVVGLPLPLDGKLYNCGVAVYEGRLLAVVPKRNIPGYSEFYEGRYFVPGPEEAKIISLLGDDIPFGSRVLLSCQEMAAFTIGIELCEDLWVASPPSNQLAQGGATVVVNLSASDEVIGKGERRRALVAGQSGRLVCGYLYADAGKGESTQDMVFGGHNLIAENGTILAESPPFGEGFAATELDVLRLMGERRRLTTYGPSSTAGFMVAPFSMRGTKLKLTRPVAMRPFVPEGDELQQRCQLILKMQSAGLEKRMAHVGSRKAVLGVSGGLDSTLALLVAVRTMAAMGRPASDVLAVSMPCFGTTTRTRYNARALSEALGATFREIDITLAVEQHLKDIGHPSDARDTTYENAQARERTQVLMDLSNQQNGLVVGTGDLSELALGWATYNGDHMSMYGVNASVPKTLVRHLVRHVAATAGDDDLMKILLDILETPVSPELLPPEEGEISQRTEDLIGPYELHDFFLYYVLRWGFPPAKVYRLAAHAFEGHYDGPVIKQWLKVFYRRFFAQQFKRSCLPDGPKIGTVTLSPRGDWRMPSDAVANLWLEEVEHIK